MSLSFICWLHFPYVNIGNFQYHLPCNTCEYMWFGNVRIKCVCCNAFKGDASVGCRWGVCTKRVCCIHLREWGCNWVCWAHWDLWPMGPMGQTGRPAAGRQAAGKGPGGRHAPGDRRPAGGGQGEGSGGRNTKHKLRSLGGKPPALIILQPVHYGTRPSLFYVTKAPSVEQVTRHSFFCTCCG